jgi:thiazole tautomerase (transcriptional regulator TenI)
VNLHLVTNDEILSRPDFVDIARQFPAEVFLHLRGYNQTAAKLIWLIQSIPNQRVIVHDRVDVVMVTNAAGVHLGVRSIPVSAARTLLRNKLIGYSAHAASEASECEADFAFLGPIFETNSHPTEVPKGLGLLTADAPDRLTAQAPRRIAIGGITTANAKQALNAGAAGIAVISGVWQSTDPVQAAREFVKILHD